jgi:hypothetical protein
LNPCLYTRLAERLEVSQKTITDWHDGVYTVPFHLFAEVRKYLFEKGLIDSPDGPDYELIKAQVLALWFFGVLVFLLILFHLPCNQEPVGESPGLSKLCPYM